MDGDVSTPGIRRFATSLPSLHRLHWSSWCVLAACVFAALIVAVSGDHAGSQYAEYRDEWQQRGHDLLWAEKAKAKPNGFMPEVELFEHGWPLLCFARTVRADDNAVAGSSPRWGRPSPSQQLGGTWRTGITRGGLLDDEAIPWTNLAYWPVIVDSAIVNWWAFAIDVVVVVGMIVVVVAAWQWRIRRRGGLFRFRLSDLLGATVVCASALGYYQWHAQLKVIEKGMNLSPDGVTKAGTYSVNEEYCGPLWLRRLVGTDRWSTFTHTTSVNMTRLYGWEAANGNLPRLRYLKQIKITCDLPLESLATLANCKRLDVLWLPPFDSHMREPQAFDGQRIFGIADLEQLQRLSVSELHLEGAAIIATDIPQLASLPNLRHMTLINVSITADEFTELTSRFPEIEVENGRTRSRYDSAAKPAISFDEDVRLQHAVRRHVWGLDLTQDEESP